MTDIATIVDTKRETAPDGRLRTVTGFFGDLPVALILIGREKGAGAGSCGASSSGAWRLGPVPLELHALPKEGATKRRPTAPCGSGRAAPAAPLG
jgi:hypothetical protein